MSAASDVPEAVWRAANNPSSPIRIAAVDDAVALALPAGNSLVPESNILFASACPLTDHPGTHNS